jgi:TP901 family phage tail tape measure protein
MADVNANIGVNIDTSEALAQLKSLQRQISQFHSSISKSSEAAALAQRDLQRNFLNSVNSIGAFSAELRNVKTTSESFTTSLEKNKFSMREYFRYAGGATQTFGKLFKSEFDTIGRVAEDRVKTLQTQYIKMGRDATGAMKAIAIRPDQLDMGNYSTQLQIAAQKQALFNQLMKQGSTNLLNFGKNTQWAGRQLMVGFTLPLLAVGSAASKAFMDMEAQALKFKKVYGDLFTPQAETEQALADIKTLSSEFTKYGIAASQTVGLAAEAAAAGFSGVDLQRQTTEATRLSVLGQIDAQQALQTTISLQNAFAISSDELADSINFLNSVENQTVTSLDDITIAIPKVAPVIQQLGGDVKDLAFFLTAMKEGGVNASEGANALKSGLAALINPTNSARKMLQGMNIDIDKIVNSNKGDLKATVIGFAQALDTLAPLERARAIETMFGKFQFARLSTLFQNVTKDGTQASRVLALAGASVEELASLADKELGMTAESAMNKFKKAVEDLKIAIIPVGEAFLKAITPIIDFISNIAEKFAGLSDRTKKAITVMVTVIGGLGPVLLMTFGLLANGVANIIKLFLTLRTGYQKLTGQSRNLGEQTQYMTMEQLEAAAAAHSLNQAHATLTQQFTAEASAVNQLITAYQNATAAGARFAMTNPGMMMPPSARKMAGGGIVVGPGSGTSDSVPAMLSNGEAVIPAKNVKKYPGMVAGLVAGNIPGFMAGTVSVGGGAATRLDFARKDTSAKAQQLIDAMLAEGTGIENALEIVQETLSRMAEDTKISIGAFTRELDVVTKELTGSVIPKEVLTASGRGERKFSAGQTGVGKLEDQLAGNPVLEEELRRAKESGRAAQKAVQNYYTEMGVDLTKTDAKTKNVLNAITQSGEVHRAHVIEMQDNIDKMFDQAWDPDAWIAQSSTLNQVSNILDSSKTTRDEYFKNLTELNADEEITRSIREKITNNIALTEQELAVQKQVLERMLNSTETASKLSTSFVAQSKGAIAATDYLIANPSQMAGVGSRTEQQKQTARQNVTQARFRGQQSFIPVTQAARNIVGPVAAQPFANSRPFQSRVDLSGPSASTLNTNPSQTNRLMSGQSGLPQLTEQQIQERNARALERIKRNAEAMANQAVQSTANAAGVQSPSRRTIPIGEDIARGLEVGMNNRKDDVAVVAQSLASAAVGGTRGPRGSYRPQGPSNVPTAVLRQTEEKMANARSTTAARAAQQQKEQQDRLTLAAQKEAEARQASVSKIGKLNNAIQGGSFALMSLSGVAQMFGGSLGKVSSVIFTLSGALFALQTVTQLLTQAKALELIQTRLGMARNVMKMAQGGGGIAGMGGLLGKSGLMGNIARLGLGISKFLGPIGLAITAVTAVVGGFKLLSSWQERQRVAVEGLGDAALLSAEKLKTLGDFFGVNPQKTPLERTGTQLVLNQEKRSEVDKLRDSEGFQKDFKTDIASLKGATNSQAALILKSLSIQLKGKGFAKEQIDTIIKSLQEESGKTDLNIDFSSIDLSTKGGQENLAKSAKVLGDRFGKQFGEGYSSETSSAVNRANGKIVTWTKETLSKGLQKNLNLTAKAFTGMINGLSGQLANGSINAQQFNQSFGAISDTITKMPKAQAMLLLNNILKTMPGELAKSAVGMKKLSDKMLIMQAAALGVATITQEMKDVLNAAAENPNDPRYQQAAAITRERIKKDMELILKGYDDIANAAAKADGTGGGSGKKSNLQLAIEQLQKQQTELKNTAKAYRLLVKAGLDAGTAMDYAKDPVVALGIATKGLKLEQVRALAELMKDIEKSASSQAITDFFLNINKENKIKEGLSGIAGTISSMGGSLEDIDNLLSNPEIATYLSDPLITAEQSAERITRYLNGIKTGKELDLKIKIATPEGVAQVFSDLASQASTYFDILQKSIQDKFADPIKTAEEAANKAADAVKAIQTEIEGLSNQSSAIQRQMDITINRPLDVLQQRSAVLSENMALIDNAAESVNAKYDAQAAALSKVSEINQEIANQQRQQLDLASAITSGDIAAAARAEQEMRATSAAGATARAGGVLDVARQRELAGLTVNGMTADQIKAEQYRIERQTFALEQQRLPLTQAIQVIEDKIYEIQNGKLVAAQKAQDAAESALTAKKNEMQVELDAIDVQRRKWDQAQLAIDNAKIAAGEFDDVIKATNDKVEKLASMWNSINTSKNITSGFGAVNDQVAAIVKDTAAVQNLQTKADAAAKTQDQSAKTAPSTSSNFTTAGIANKLKSMGFLASGGMVPKYFASGGYSRGTDTVPAMLTPGEFVVRRFAVDKFGVNNLNAINDGTFKPKSSVASVTNSSNSVYNYGISVNVSNSNASTDDIARAVITQIRNIDNQRIRGQR